MPLTFWGGDLHTLIYEFNTCTFIIYCYTVQVSVQIKNKNVPKRIKSLTL